MLPFEKLTFANLVVETNIFLFNLLNLKSLSSINFFDAPKKLDGSTALSEEIENTSLRLLLLNFFIFKKFLEFVLNKYLALNISSSDLTCFIAAKFK